MERKYVYKNGIIYIKLNDSFEQNVRKATEEFLHKVILEKEKK